jgi:AcrR family transcriptional regulator
MPDSTATTAERVDGRRASRDRNRLAVVDALLDLYAEGNMRPGADEVAKRAGLSRRSVFRYFDDLDDLDRTAIARQQERVRPLWDIRDLGEGTLSARIEAIAAMRCTLFEAVGPAARVSRMRAPIHPVIARELAESRKLFIRQVERQFAPELNALPEEERDRTVAALDVICSFESFDLMRVAHGMSVDEVRAAMAAALRVLLRDR